MTPFANLDSLHAAQNQMKHYVELNFELNPSLIIKMFFIVEE